MMKYKLVEKRSSLTRGDIENVLGKITTNTQPKRLWRSTPISPSEAKRLGTKERMTSFHLRIL